jgi:hypothetical protein
LKKALFLGKTLEVFVPCEVCGSGEVCGTGEVHGPGLVGVDDLEYK